MDIESVIDEYLSMCGHTMESMNAVRERFAKRPGYDIIAKHIQNGTHPKIDARIREVYSHFVSGVFPGFDVYDEFSKALTENPDNVCLEYITKIHRDSFSLNHYGRVILWEKMRDECASRGPVYEAWKKMFEFSLQVENKDPEHVRIVEESVALLGGLPFPGTRTPQDFEVSVMSMCRFAGRHCTDSEAPALSLGYVPYYVGKNLSAPAKVLESVHSMPGCYQFGSLWMESGFPRVEVGHKLSAALALTDVPNPVDSPWNHWSLVIPDGMFPTSISFENKDLPPFDTSVYRLWCQGSDAVMIVIEIPEADGLKGGVIAIDIDRITGVSEKAREMINNLTRSLCLSITDKGDDRKGTWGKPNAKINKFKSRCSKPMESVGERYVIGRPVVIDLRDDFKQIIRGDARDKSSSKYSFLVRGHFRNQCYGPGRKQHRRQWIEPFWKGEAGNQILLRPYEIVDDKKD